MRCKVCREQAEIELPRHNACFCREHFLTFFINQVKRGIGKQQMVSHQERILVVVSGGKDSLVLWDVLRKLGYQADGLYIDLGIGEYSLVSKEKCLAFAARRQLELFVLPLAELVGMGIEKISEKVRREPCAVCGLIKRYFFNRFALEMGYEVVATGHNLDDEAATLLGNLLYWHEGYLKRQSPLMPSNHPKMVKKVKPLYRLTEKETSAYAIMEGIDYIFQECPQALGARSVLYKRALNYLEAASPGTKHQLYFGFLQKGKAYFREEKEVDLRACSLCGQPTVLECCAFCTLLSRIGVAQWKLQEPLITIAEKKFPLVLEEELR